MFGASAIIGGGGDIGGGGSIGTGTAPGGGSISGGGVIGSPSAGVISAPGGGVAAPLTIPGISPAVEATLAASDGTLTDWDIGSMIYLSDRPVWDEGSGEVEPGPSLKPVLVLIGLLFLVSKL